MCRRKKCLAKITRTHAGCDYCVWFCIVVYILLLGDLRYLYVLGHMKFPHGGWSSQTYNIE